MVEQPDGSLRRVDRVDAVDRMDAGPIDPPSRFVPRSAGKGVARGSRAGGCSFQCGTGALAGHFPRYLHLGEPDHGLEARATSKTNMAVALALALAVVLLPGVAAGQAAITVDDDNVQFPGAAFSSIQLAVLEAIDESQTSGHVEVWVAAGTYPENISIPADANISVLGITPLALDLTTDEAPFEQPYTVIVDGGSGDCLTINAEDALGNPLSGDLSRLRIEGLSFANGRNGIVNTGIAAVDADYSPTISRCSIGATDGVAGNFENGALVQGNATPLFDNCVMGQNGDAGVRVEGTAVVDLMHCSIIDNGNYGVFVATGANAIVRNTLVYRNGGVSTFDIIGGTLPAVNEGGVVFETNPGITPSSGPVVGGTGVTVTGTGFTDVAELYFDGAPATGVGVSGDTTITATTPAAPSGRPGVVDVRIARANTLSVTMRQAYTYVADTATPPVVTRLNPVHGPLAGTNWVAVYGRNFDPDCVVFVDFNGDGARQANEIAGGKEYLSHAELYVRMPSATAAGAPAGPYNLHVYNPASALTSAAGPQYTYRADPAAQPIVTQITPEEASLSDGTVTARVFGWNFVDNSVVRIGGMAVSHGDVQVLSADGAETFCVIDAVSIPLAAIGGPGVYDVEVTNPDGLFDILHDGFTLFWNGQPVTAPAETDVAFVWEQANFSLYNGGGDTRTLHGAGFDDVVDVAFDDDAALPPLAVLTGLTPSTPTMLDIPMPSRPEDLDAAFLGDRVVRVAVVNTDIASGQVNYHWVDDPANTFSITNVSQSCYAVDVSVDNWTAGMELYVKGRLVPATAYTVTPPVAPSTISTLSLDLGLLVRVPDNFFEFYTGPADVAVVLPSGQAWNATGEALYWVEYDAVQIHPMVENAAADPPGVTPALYGRAVVPREVPLGSPFTVTVLGSGFRTVTQLEITDDLAVVHTVLPGQITLVSSNELRFNASAIAGTFTVGQAYDVVLRNDDLCVGYPDDDVMEAALVYAPAATPDPPVPPDFSDGRPVIAYITPNHSDETTSSVEITIRGEDFALGAQVEFTFGGTTFSRAAEVLSPTELVIDVPSAATLGIDPADYVAGMAAVEVRVRNLPEPAGAPVDATLSNMVEFFYLDDTVEPIEPLVPVLEYNDVYLNYRDYVNAEAGTGSISVDPLLDPAGAWLGKLAYYDPTPGDDSLQDAESPLEGTAASFSDPRASQDYENQLRPYGSGPEIGADEIVGRELDLGDLIGWWVEAYIDPNPIPEMDAEELDVLVRLTTVVPVRAVNTLFLVPQGVPLVAPAGSDYTTDGFSPVPDGVVDFNDVLYEVNAYAAGTITEPRLHIPLRTTDVGGGAGVITATNDLPITTVLYNADTASDVPSANDLIADGHAVLHITDGTRIYAVPLGFATLSAAPEVDVFFGYEQAVTGRHALIDTVAPHVDIDYYTNLSGLAYATAEDFVTAVDTGALPSALVPPNHPSPPGDVNWEPPAPPATPIDDGQLVYPATGNQRGSQIFINHASVSNGSFVAPSTDPANSLDLVVSVRMIDDHVRDVDQNLLLAQDIYTGENVRQVAGFVPGSLQVDDAVFEDDVVADDIFDLPAWWARNTALDDLTGQPLQVIFDTTGAAVGNDIGVYDPVDDDINDPYLALPRANDQLAADWNFQDLTGAGLADFRIPFDTQIDNYLHMPITFRAQDLAGNATEGSEQIDPVHVWWITNTQARLTPNREGMVVSDPSFTFEVNRDFDPQALGMNPPLFTYRLWYSADYNGVYQPLPPPYAGWLPPNWTTTRSIAGTDIQDALADSGITDAWVLITLRAADEAANVQPVEVAAQGASIDMAVFGPAALVNPGWQRFYISSQPMPDTRVAPVFWHGDADADLSTSDPSAPGDVRLGPLRIVPMAAPGSGREIEVEFYVDGVRPPENQTAGIRFVWSLLQEGQVIMEMTNPAPPDPPQDRIILRFAEADLQLPLNPDGSLPYAVNYTFRVWAFFDRDNDGNFIPPDLRDPTPANVQFTVVPPGGAGEYIGRFQKEQVPPVKAQEEQ